MRTCLLLGVLALALLALPAAVAAAGSATTDISGTIETTFTVMVVNTTLDIGTMDVGYNPPGSPGNVNTTVMISTTGPIASWSLTAKDSGSVKNGFMLDGGTNLTEPLEFTWNTPSSWTDITTQRTIASGIAPGGFMPVFFRQEIEAGQAVGIYTIKVLFEGSVL